MNNVKLYEKIPANDFPIRLQVLKGKKTGEMRIHWHEHTEILYFFDGTGMVSIGGKNIEAKPGDLIIANQNEIHAGDIQGNCIYGCILLPPYFFEDNHIIFESLVQDDDVCKLAEKIFDEFIVKKPAYKTAVKAYTYMLVTLLTRNHARAVLNDKAYKIKVDKLNKINEAIEYINEYYTEDISTEFLSETVHISIWHFCRLFKEVTGKTPKEYINDIRISKACGLIENTDMTITEIAGCCGFNDMNYFSRYFKMRMGVSPTKYGK